MTTLNRTVTTTQVLLTLTTLAAVACTAAWLTRGSDAAFAYGALAAFIAGAVISGIGIVSVVRRASAPPSPGPRSTAGQVAVRAFTCAYGSVSIALGVLMTIGLARSLEHGMPSLWPVAIIGPAIPFLVLYGVCLVRLALTGNPGNIYWSLLGKPALSGRRPTSGGCS